MTRPGRVDCRHTRSPTASCKLDFEAFGVGGAGSIWLTGLRRKPAGSPASRCKVKLGHSHNVEQEDLVSARMLRLPTGKEVDVGRIHGGALNPTISAPAVEK